MKNDFNFDLTYNIFLCKRKFTSNNSSLCLCPKKKDNSRHV